MTKEMAILLLESKDVYLTNEGKMKLEEIIYQEKKVVTSR